MADLGKTSDVGVVTPVLPGRSPGQRRKSPRKPARSTGEKGAKHPKPDGDHKVDEYA